MVLDAATFANQLRCVDQEGCAGDLLEQAGRGRSGIWPLLKSASTMRPPRSHEAAGNDRTPRCHRADRVVISSEATRNDRREAPTVGRTNAAMSAKLTSSGLTIRQSCIWARAKRRGLPDFRRWPRSAMEAAGSGHPQTLQCPRHVFVLGKQARRYPGSFGPADEGHEIGSHTYMPSNLSEASDEQVTLELNAPSGCWNG